MAAAAAPAAVSAAAAAAAKPASTSPGSASAPKEDDVVIIEKRFLTFCMGPFRKGSLETLCTRLGINSVGTKPVLAQRIAERLRTIPLNDLHVLQRDYSAYSAMRAFLKLLIDKAVRNGGVVPGAPTGSILQPVPPAGTAPAPAKPPIAPDPATEVFSNRNTATGFNGMCVCGVSDGEAPTIFCATPQCPGASHRGCALAKDDKAEELKAWRCPSCRACGVMPGEMLLVVCGQALVKEGAALTRSFKFTGEPPSTGRFYKVVALPLARSAYDSITWPAGLSVSVNGVPAAAPMPRTAVDVTAATNPDSNEVVIKIVSAPVLSRGYFTIVVVRTLVCETVGSVVRHLAERRMPPWSVAWDWTLLNLELQQRPLGTFRGLSTPTLRNAIALRPDVNLEWRIGIHETLGESSPIEIEVEELSVSLKDPFTFEGIRIPVRGDSCKHAQCFDLQNYLELNAREKARWKCPVCNELLLPHHLWIDRILLQISYAVRQGMVSGSCSSKHSAAIPQQLHHLPMFVRSWPALPPASLRVNVLIRNNSTWRMDGTPAQLASITYECTVAGRAEVAAQAAEFTAPAVAHAKRPRLAASLLRTPSPPKVSIDLT